jgi:hypothetical protein
MKTLLKIGVALILVTMAVQGARAALKHYTFVDTLREAMLFAGSRSEDELADRVMQLADDNQVPLDPATVTVRREPFVVVVHAPYTDRVDLLPGLYSRAWDFDASVNVRLLEDTRPRGPAVPRRRKP